MILAGSQDAGPMRYLLSLQSSLGKPVQWLGSEITAPMIKQTGQRCWDHWEDAQVDLILTGTSLGKTLDKQLIQWGITEKIPTVSVIEHWSWYRKRFELGSELVFPDFIIVNDDTAKENGVADGLPEDKLFVGGNPWLEKLAQTGSPEFDVSAWRERHQLPRGHLTMFISEALKDDFGPHSSDYLGYDEYVALKGVLSVLPNDSALVIKRHPAEPKDKWADWVDHKKVFQIGTVPVEDLALGADAIVGMASSATSRNVI